MQAAAARQPTVTSDRIVIVAHPGSVDVDALAHAVRAAVAERGGELLRLDLTTPADPGTGLARQAAADGCDVVIACGGDGTVRAVATALVGTDVALGIVPTGTGNLLARNLDLPSDLEAAVDVALGDAERRLDCGRLDEHIFVVMAGIGLDAAMVRDAPVRLKKVLGWPAYVVSAAQHLLDPSMRVHFRIDDGRWQTRRARSVVVGNVGALQAGITLFPDSDPSDGVLELALLCPRSFVQWARLGIGLVRSPRRRTRGLERHSFRRFELTTAEPAPAELDGDPAGSLCSFVVKVEPAALRVRVPR